MHSCGLLPPRRRLSPGARRTQVHDVMLNTSSCNLIAIWWPTALAFKGRSLRTRTGRNTILTYFSRPWLRFCTRCGPQRAKFHFRLKSSCSLDFCSFASIRSGALCNVSEHLWQHAGSDGKGRAVWRDVRLSCGRLGAGQGWNAKSVKR